MNTKQKIMLSVLTIFSLPNTYSMVSTGKDAQLLASIKNENFENAINLLNSGANPNATIKNGFTQESPFLEALNATRYVFQKNKRQVLDVLIETFINKGANINQQKFDGDTPIFSALSLESVKSLVKAGTDINHQNMFGVTPLQSLLNEKRETDNSPFKEERENIIQYLRSIGAH